MEFRLIENEIQTNGSYTIDDVIAYANEHHLENLIAIMTILQVLF
jgi:aspartokinase/homoserine dehydrogenase 1